MQVFEGGAYVTHDIEAIIATRQESVERKLAFFGKEGSGRLFKIGPYGNLVGQRVDSLGPPGSPVAKGGIYQPEKFQQISLEDRFIPGEIVGFVEQSPQYELPWIVVAVNGVIRAVTRPYERSSGRHEALRHLFQSPPSRWERTTSNSSRWRKETSDRFN